MQVLLFLQEYGSRAGCIIGMECHVFMQDGIGCGGKRIRCPTLVYAQFSDSVNISDVPDLQPCIGLQDEWGFLVQGCRVAEEKGLILAVATRFAAKEAVSKAFGTGFRDGIYLSDIEILNDNLGRPTVRLTGNAKKYMQKIAGNNFNIHLSLSDDYPFALAFVIIEK